MAALYRKPYNLCGSTLGAILATGATSVTFSGALKEGGSSGTNIATLGADEYLVMTVGSEVVYLTAYTSGATSGTIVRGQEGTADPGVSYPVGAPITNNATKLDRGDVAFTYWSLNYI